MTYMKTTTPRLSLQDFDRAIDFAYGHRTAILFCGKMVRRFERFGTLTPAQVAALLKIREKRR